MNKKYTQILFTAHARNAVLVTLMLQEHYFLFYFTVTQKIENFLFELFKKCLPLIPLKALHFITFIIPIIYIGTNNNN